MLALTCDYDGASSFYFITNTAVRATVFRKTFPDEELQSRATLLNLVFLSVAQHVATLLPLHQSTSSGDLTAEAHYIALLHLNILKLLEEFDGPLWRKPQNEVHVQIEEEEDLLRNI